jgi:predicted nicotinamide N-methyase
MPYQTILTEITKNLSINIPDPESLKKTYDGLRETDENLSFPFWAKIWPSSKAITAFLMENIHFVESKTVLEIGAGIGLPSFTISNYAAKLIISDHSTDAIKLIERNIEYLKLTHAKAILLDWNDFPENLTADTIILSDINYDPTQMDQLVILINHFLEANSNIIISTPERITATLFGKAIQPYIKESFLQDIEESGKLMQIRIMIL